MEFSNFGIEYLRIETGKIEYTLGTVTDIVPTKLLSPKYAP